MSLQDFDSLPDDTTVDTITAVLRAARQSFTNEETLIKACILCDTEYHIPVEASDLAEYKSPDRRKIQEVFPYLPSGDRELLISGICEKCFDDYCE